MWPGRNDMTVNFLPGGFRACIRADWYGCSNSCSNDNQTDVLLCLAFSSPWAAVLKDLSEAHRSNEAVHAFTVLYRHHHIHHKRSSCHLVVAIAADVLDLDRHADNSGGQKPATAGQILCSSSQLSTI